jgi:antitoxin (DNA-binding transcriptional repressor) of toxin-antitoxin stability system
MPVVNMLEAKTNLSRLVEQLESGAESEIIIARNGRPAARLVPLGPSLGAGKRLGLVEGQYPSFSQDEFDEADDEIARLFRGDT